MRVAQLAKIFQPLLELSPGFLDMRMGHKTAEKFQRRKEPPGLDTQIVHSLFGKVLAALFEGFPVSAPTVSKGFQQFPAQHVRIAIEHRSGAVMRAAMHDSGGKQTRA